MRYRNLTLAAFIFLFGNFHYGISQITKTYQGAYENGTATYQYYDNEKFERLFQGPFKYKGVAGDGIKGKLSLSVTGQYDNNKRTGTWTFTLKDPNLRGTTETVTGNYSNGMMDGSWSSIITVNNTKKVVKRTSAQFKNNKLSGELVYDLNTPLSKDYSMISLKGNFSDSNFFDGTWSTTYKLGGIQYEEIRKYKNGVIYWLLHRRLSDGKILEKIDSTTFVEQFFQNYDDAKKYAIIQNQKFVFKANTDTYTGNLEIPIAVIKYWSQKGHSLVFNDLTAPNPAFMIEKGYEPSSFFYERSIVNWSKTHEGELQLIKEDQEKKLQLEKYQSLIDKADLLFKSKQYTEAVETYKSAITVKDDSYPRDQMQKAQLIIEEERIAKEQEQKAKDQSYLQIIAQADDAVKNSKYDVAIELYQSALTIKKEAYPEKQIELARQHRNDDYRQKTIEGFNRLWVTIDGGKFKMGAFKTDILALDVEFPAHDVTLSSFQISKYEVTIGQYRAFCKVKGKPEPQGQDSLPVTNINWKDASEFAEWVGGRLPSEAEWEYAARGGLKNKHTYYSGSSKVEEVAWSYTDNTKTAHPVGLKKPNILGLYDMSGNVWEWCSDWYAEYTDKSDTNPQGPGTGNQKVKRGGSFNDKNYETDLRVTNRASEPVDYSSYNLGFRIVKIN